MSYPRLAARLYGQPLFLYPDKAKLIEEVFRAHLAGTAKPLAMEDDGPQESEEQRLARIHDGRVRQYAGIKLQRRDDKPYALTQSGIALIPVMGTLIQRGSWMDSMSGLTSYGEISAMLDRAALDSDVKGILLEFDSPGGEVAGAFELSARIAAMREESKPIWGHANEAAFSSAYLQMSAVERAYTPETGMVGNIGVLMIHVDQSKADEKKGLAYTFIHAGEQKVDGNSHEPLSDRARAAAQLEVDRMYGMFVESVSKYRGIKAEDVKATEAAILNADRAKASGFIDDIATFAQTVARLEAELQQPSMTGARTAGRQMRNPTLKETQMKKASTAATLILAAMSMSMESVSEAAGASLEKSIGEITEPVRVAALTEGEKVGETKGVAIGVKAERERVKAILGSDEAKGRGKLAMTLATETDNTPEQAKKLLAAAQIEGVASPMRSAMNQIANPAVGSSEVAAGGADEDAETMARRIAGHAEVKRAQ